MTSYEQADGGRMPNPDEDGNVIVVAGPVTLSVLNETGQWVKVGVGGVQYFTWLNQMLALLGSSERDVIEEWSRGKTDAELRAALDLATACGAFPPMSMMHA